MLEASLCDLKSLESFYKQLGGSILVVKGASNKGNGTIIFEILILLAALGDKKSLSL